MGSAGLNEASCIVGNEDEVRAILRGGEIQGSGGF